MARLTEEMVVARTRASDLSAIKKLNCWGGELQDISLLRRMSNVEVLSLSVNKISSLADVQYCKNLRELYVRKNEIKNLNEICYLKNLPYLKALWLGENPCSASDSLYRFTVIKNLPTLEKLDDVQIEPEERQDSMRKGRDLIHPEDSDYENNSPVQSPVRASVPSRTPPESTSSSDQDDEPEVRKPYSSSHEDDQPPQYAHQTANESKYYQANDRTNERKPVAAANKTSYNNRRPSENAYEQPYDNGVTVDNVVSEKQIDTHTSSYLNRCNSDTSIVVKKEKGSADGAVRTLTQQITAGQEEYEGDCPPENNKEGYCNCAPHHYDRRTQMNSTRNRDRGDGTRCSSSDGSGRTSPQKGQERAYRQYDNYRIDADRYTKNSPYPPRRPVTRNSNLLSAVLCLIKELDYPSLEVVAIAVRCRMDEFDD